jgi:phytoene dehydrogenase-like protein
MTTSTDTLVIGAGFGGLSAALHLAPHHDVVLCEALNYPGGCAATFRRGGIGYQSGATMFAGFAPGQWMHGWLDRYALEVSIELLDPVVHFRTPDHDWTLSADRGAFLDHLCALPDAPVAGIRSFFAELVTTADTLWALFDDPSRLPPFTLSSFLGHVPDALRYAGLLRSVLRPLAARMAAHGVADFAPLRTWVDAVCQITVQTDAAHAEAPVAMAAIDYFFRGTAHVHGGIGTLAEAVVQALERQGVDVRLATRVKSLERQEAGWTAEVRGDAIQARRVVANLLPQDVDGLIGRPATSRLAEEVGRGWGACMLYVTVDSAGLPPGPFHIQAVLDPSQPLVEGNLVLVSVCEENEDLAPAGLRSASVSTHAPLVPEDDQAAHIARIQDRMRANLAARCPELVVRSELPASPRTFARFTKRSRGLVGGIPRLHGLRNYLDLWPTPYAPDLHLVGDSTFPGQSVLAVATGGYRTAASIVGSAVDTPVNRPDR